MLTLVLVVAAAPIILAEFFDRVARRAGCQQKELALTQSIPAAQWSQQLHGRGHVSFGRLWHLPLSARHALLEELAEAWDVPRPAHTIDDVYRLLWMLVPLRVRRAALVTVEDEQEAVSCGSRR